MIETESSSDRKLRYATWAEEARKVGFAVHVDEFGRGTVMSSTLDPIGRLLEELSLLRSGIAPCVQAAPALFSPGWPADESSLSVDFRLEGSNGFEWRSIGWRDDNQQDLCICETLEVADARLSELMATLVSPEIIRIGGHAWKALRIVQQADASAMRVVKVIEHVPNPGLDAAMARYPIIPNQS